MKKKTKRNIIIAILVVLLFIICFVIWLLFFQKTTPDDVMEMIVKDNKDAVISVGIWEDGKEEMYIYTKDGKKDFVEYKYQIGSITKTFTGAMLAKEVYDGKMSLNDPVGKYLELSEKSYNPTFEKLVTHRSGLSTLWEDYLAKSDDIFKENFSRADMIKMLEDSCVDDGSYNFEYSNFGTGLVGTATSNEIDNNSSYKETMDKFIKEELGLDNTTVGDIGDFENNYLWSQNDEMMGAGAIVSTVPDLLEYGKMYLSDDSKYDFLDLCTKPVGSMDDTYDIGYFWLIDKEEDIIWHNGEIAYDDEDGNEVGYMSFIGVSPKKNKVVVVLYNGISYDGDDALTDILGYLLLEE